VKFPSDKLELAHAVWEKPELINPWEKNSNKDKQHFKPDKKRFGYRFISGKDRMKYLQSQKYSIFKPNLLLNLLNDT